MKAIARVLPRDDRVLFEACFLTNDQIASFGQAILAATMSHARDRQRFTDCVRELRLFALSGPYGLQLLNKVHMPILQHFGMMHEKWVVFDAAGIWINPDNGRITARGSDD